MEFLMRNLNLFILPLVFAETIQIAEIDYCLLCDYWHSSLAARIKEKRWQVVLAYLVFKQKKKEGNLHVAERLKGTQRILS